MQDSYSEAVRTAGLYLLYSIFFQINKPQPPTLNENTSPKNVTSTSVKFFKDRTNSPILIRVTVKTYQNILNLVNFLEINKHLDAVYAFKCLLEYDAFLFCVNPIISSRSSLYTQNKLIHRDIRNGLPCIRLEREDETFLNREILPSLMEDEEVLPPADKGEKASEIHPAGSTGEHLVEKLEGNSISEQATTKITSNFNSNSIHKRHPSGSITAQDLISQYNTEKIKIYLDKYNSMLDNQKLLDIEIEGIEKSEFKQDLQEKFNLPDDMENSSENHLE